MPESHNARDDQLATWLFLPRGGIVVNCSDPTCPIGIIHDPSDGPTPTVEHDERKWHHTVIEGSDG